MNKKEIRNYVKKNQITENIENFIEAFLIEDRNNSVILKMFIII